MYSEGISEREANFLYQDELKYGDTGIEVQYIHYYLDAIAFLDPDIPRLPTNSIYNNNTISMVKAFQSKYNLPVTGVFTYTDWNVLRNVYKKLLETYNGDYSDYINDLDPDYFLTRGSSGEDVLRLQKFLYKICEYDHSIPGVRVNGLFDELTEKSVLKLQKDYGFDVNGIVGPLLWRKVVELSKR